MICNKCGNPVHHEALYCHNCGQAVRTEKEVPKQRLPGVLAGAGGGFIGSILVTLWCWYTGDYFYSAVAGFLLGMLVFGGFWLGQKDLDRTAVLIGAGFILLFGLAGNFCGWGAAIWGPGTETDYNFLSAAMLMVYSSLMGHIDPMSFWFSTLEVYGGALFGAIAAYLLWKKLGRKPLPKL